MTVTPDTLPRHELIGLTVTVEDAANADLIGLSGRVVRETMNTLFVRPDPAGSACLGDPTRRARQVPKQDTTFAFELPDGQTVAVAGERLIARPARRTETRGESPWV